MAHDEHEKTSHNVPAIAARIAVAIVFALNVQCALQFVLWPDAFAGAYELSGVAGEAAVGETAILLGLPAGHEVLAASILRFIAFDAGGLVLMAAAFAWMLIRGRSR